VPEQYINVDQDKYSSRVSPSAMSIKPFKAYMGGLFVNYFNDFGRTWQVYIEAEAPYRANTQDLSQFYVRNNQGQNVPLSSLANFETDYGPGIHLRYNEYRRTDLRQRCPGYSSQTGDRGPRRCFSINHAPRNWLRLHGYVYQEQKARRVCQPGPFSHFHFSSFF